MSTKSPERILEECCEGLSVDISSLSPSKYGLYSCAKILAHKYDSVDYDTAAGRILLHLITTTGPQSVDEYLDIFKDVLSERVKKFFNKHKHGIALLIKQYEHHDKEFGWLALSCIHHNYMLRTSYMSDSCETVGLMWMRIAVDMFAEGGLDAVEEAFIGMRKGEYMPASPFLYSGGTEKSQHRSCFLWSVSDNLESILDHGVKWPGLISKERGGCGFDVSRLRNSEISNVGFSDGIMPWLRLYNQVPACVNQLGKRAGAVTVHVRSHHINVAEAISSMLKTGHPDSRIRNIQLSVMFSWLFWERFENNEDWTLFCPALTEKLNDKYGVEFEAQYLAYEGDKSTMERSTRINARKLAMHMFSVQVRSSLPYIMNFDSMNYKSNHRHHGIIRSSNLCLEIVQHFDEGEIASCNLHSVSVKAPVMCEYVNDSASIEDNLINCYDFDKLASVCRQCVRNLDSSIDVSSYPLDAHMRPNNERNRPLSIGVSGLADAIYSLDLSFERKETRVLNKMVFACMYFNALCESVILASKHGACEGHKGSPASEGKLQFDLWAEEYQLLKRMGRIDNRVRTKEMDIPISPKSWGQRPIICGDVSIEPSWDSLKASISKFGLRNTLLIGLMPTATSSQPLGNCETVEPPQSNIYLRRLVSGDYPVLNKYMTKDLTRINLWNKHTIDLLIADGGSARLLPMFIKSNPNMYKTFIDWDRLGWIVEKYKTMWELPQKLIIDLAADRARYVDQSMSTNIYMREPSVSMICCAVRYSFAHGLKTIMYYLRMNPYLGRPDSMLDPHIVDFVNSNSSGSRREVIRSTESSCQSCQ